MYRKATMVGLVLFLALGLAGCPVHSQYHGGSSGHNADHECCESDD
ncbi:MAG: hypothetical protein VW729_03910 [Deltaproteobacteria bacterium]|jgi:biotin transporter BioY